MQDMKRQNEANEQESLIKRRSSMPAEITTEQTPPMARSIMSEPISRPSDRVSFIYPHFCFLFF